MTETSSRRPHPHFDDRGTLDWNTTWAEAREQAAREGKPIFIEFGRELCSQCRALVQGAVPHEEIAPLLQEHFVALAADADDSEDEVIQLAMKLQDAMMLPFVIFADAEGNFLDGYAGTSSPPYLLRTLRKLIAE